MLSAKSLGMHLPSLQSCCRSGGPGAERESRTVVSTISHFDMCNHAGPAAPSSSRLGQSHTNRAAMRDLTPGSCGNSVSGDAAAEVLDADRIAALQFGGVAPVQRVDGGRRLGLRLDQRPEIAPHFPRRGRSRPEGLGLGRDGGGLGRVRSAARGRSGHGSQRIGLDHERGFTDRGPRRRPWHAIASATVRSIFRPAVGLASRNPRSDSTTAALSKWVRMSRSSYSTRRRCVIKSDGACSPSGGAWAGVWLHSSMGKRAAVKVAMVR